MEKKLFLPDEPIEELTKDAFGHTAFVSTLYKCIKSSDHKMNMGLFGKWGVGKTSILKMLFNHIKESDENIKVFLFDAWKYLHGNLCQELVLQLNKEFQVLKQDELEKEIYCAQEEESPTPDRTMREKLLETWRRFSISISATVILLILFISLRSLELIPANVYQSWLFIVFLPLITDLIIKMNSAVSRTAKMSKLPAKFDPSRIETKFTEIVDKIISQKKATKLVIAIDNLDRCSSENAIEMLEAIKALLEHDKCIYLVSCNDEALIQNLTLKKGYNIRDATEFLRKFFQTSLVIPPLISTDLEKFTKGLLEELEIEYTIQVLEVIINAFMDNPRKIKQFLNNLTIQYLLAQEREKVGILNVGEITNNDGFLAKILIIRQEYRLFYEELEYRENLLEEVERHFRGGEQLSYESIDKKSKQDIFEDNPGLEQFLKSTRLINVADVTPFLKLNRETYISSISNVQEFKLQVNRGNTDYIIENLEKLEPENEKIEFVRQIINLVNRELKVSHYDWGFNGVDILVKIHNRIPNKAKQEVARYLGQFLTLVGIREHIRKFGYDLVFTILPEMKAEYRDDLFVQYAGLLTPEKMDVELIDQFIKYHSIVPDEAITKLNSTMKTAYSENKENGIAIIKRISANPEARIKLISSELVERIEESISNSVTDENQQTIDLYLQLKDISPEPTRLEFINKLLSIISTNKNNVYDNTKAFGLRNLVQLDLNDIPKESVDKLYTTIDEFTGLLNPPNDKLHFVDVAFKFFEVFAESQQTQYINQRILPLVNSGDAAILRSILERAVKYEVKLLDYEPLLEGFANRVRSNLPEIELIKMIGLNAPKPSRDKVKDMLIHLINHPQPPYHDAGLQSFKNLYEELTTTQISEISEACLQKSTSAPTQQKRKYITPILELFEKNTVQFKRRFADYTAEFIANDEIEVSNLGIECYNTIKDSIEEEKRKAIIIRVMRVIEQKAAQDMINKDTERLLNLVIVEQSILDRSDLKGLIDTLHALLNEAKPKETQILGIRHLARISKFHQRKKMVIGTLQAYLENPDEEIREQARLALGSITGKDTKESL